MAVNKDLDLELSAMLESGDFDSAMPLIESMSSEQLSELPLPEKRIPLDYACQHSRADIAEQLITDYKLLNMGKQGHEVCASHDL